MYTLRQYLTTLEEPSGLCRTLEPFELCRDQQGRPLYAVGNSAAVFRIRREGRLQALRCYMRPAEHLAEIYGSRLLTRELFLYTSPDEGVWCDVVVDDWVEGRTLREEIDLALQAADRERLGALANRFDRLAARLVADDWAHGDLKPENIVVRPSGELQLIDFDAMFLPAFAGRRSPELGTTAYQHPAREAGDLDASLDDYPAALISTALHALALDPSLAARHASDGLLFTPSRMDRDGVLEEVLTLFEQRGMAVAYRIARLLCSPTLQLFGLEHCCALPSPAPTGRGAPVVPKPAVQQPKERPEPGKWPEALPAKFHPQPRRPPGPTPGRSEPRKWPEKRPNPARSPSSLSRTGCGATAATGGRSFRPSTTAASTSARGWRPYGWGTRGTTSTAADARGSACRDARR